MIKKHFNLQLLVLFFFYFMGLQQYTSLTGTAYILTSSITTQLTPFPPHTPAPLPFW